MAVRFTYHGSPFASQISQQGFRPGGLMSIAPGQVFSSPSASFASGYGSPVRMVTPTSALSIPSANLSTGTIGSEVIQSPKAATRGMNLASKVGTTYTGPTAQRLMSGATVSGLGPRGTSLLSRLTGGPLGVASLAGTGIGMTADAIARATNTPEEYEAMKEAARVSGGTGYMDFTDEELGIDVDAAQTASTGPFNYGAAQASEVTPQNEPMDIEDFLGTSTPQNLGFIEDAPQVKEAIYQDRIMNPNLPGFASQPQYRIRDQLKRDFLEGGLFKDAKQSLGQTKDAFLEDVSGVKNIIGSGTKKGFDFAKQIPGMILSAATGIPFAGQIAQGIGGLLGSVFQESPEQKNFRENIATDPEYQNLVSQIPGMSNYNQIFAMGSGRGLMGAADRRLATINKTLGRMTPQQLAQTSLKKRKAKLEALREIERQKESAFLESQRRGRRPGTGGDGGGGTQDSGGPTGGYSYDSGGRQGFGYGLKDGGIASMFTRRG